MKKLFYFILIGLAFSACNNKSKKYQIEGNIKGADSGKVYLVKADNGQPIAVDTAEITNGAFSFKGEAGLPEMYYLRLDARNYFAQFFLEKGNIKVEANKDSLQNTVVSGTESNELFNSYIAEMKRLNVEYTNLRNKANQATMKGDESAIKEMEIGIDALLNNMEVYARNFVSEHRESMVAPFIYMTQLVNQASAEELDTIVDIFPKKYAESTYVKEIARIAGIKKNVKIGALALDFTMNDPEGKPVTLSSFRGKYLLIDFWASWCAPCRKENPNVVRIYKKYKDKGFEILGVSLDRDKAAWVKAIKDDELSWTHVSDLKYWQNEVAVLYGVQSIPYTVLLDKEGKIIETSLRSEELEDKLAELLGE